MEDEVTSIVMVRKWTAITKTVFSEEETERILSLRSEEEARFKSLHKDYFKNDVIKLVFKPQLLQQLPVNPSLSSPS